jgi:hypothetical protein
MDKEPGWVKENELAESLGWTPKKDFNRGQSDDCYWCKFQKFDLVVWKGPYQKWVKAEYYNGEYKNHQKFDTLEEALT